MYVMVYSVICLVSPVQGVCVCVMVYSVICLLSPVQGVCM